MATYHLYLHEVKDDNTSKDVFIQSFNNRKLLDKVINYFVKGLILSDVSHVSTWDLHARTGEIDVYIQFER